mmetsp:Transcript_49262/g.73311  ORF Transcript_49262/g.73311 Transcript_49262/m.73311 type:complete len:396 (+) Transcript_49262:480-1667(+)|eukprot:CAMPEP_0195513984 /NCGR_PEP_ID=MMETSP0794_2-20130614/5514_1 /TAXON_ID=515487 /ORGANISM="Stephanopyxis turris, Strain CCMP 815" /LENGTH=395 /DNA_ID=CAMNT_0040642135 /DNA_START=478 /DNA_END=1665 /DNA_ORIENTATION=-
MANSVSTSPVTSKGLKIDVEAVESGYSSTSKTAPGLSTPSTVKSDISSQPNETTLTRGSSDIRSPGAEQTPRNANVYSNGQGDAIRSSEEDAAPIPDFITQTDEFGNPNTPRNVSAIESAKVNSDASSSSSDECNESDGLLDSLRSMCCCLLLEDGSQNNASGNRNVDNGHGPARISNGRINMQEKHSHEEKEEDKTKLLPEICPEDAGKKCLVLDLDETLVHSSFRAVPGADFVIPVQIDDVVHFVYVAKRPGVDEFLLEMSKYYEIVIYTASLNKYADPLLDLLDPHKVIRARLFRESCVYYEGNYVKDLSLINRDLTQSIIVDNSPNSYIFHPENAIDCSSFIDDPADRELDQIATFLKGVRDVNDVRHFCSMWKRWGSAEDELYGSESKRD